MKRSTILILSSLAHLSNAFPFLPSLNLHGSSISPQLFENLEELARIVDISYCVGSTGIHKPFKCAGRCSDFEGFELIEQWNTGILMSDSCGYVALSHAPFEKRIIVAFRGTYSIANTVADLSTIPADYEPYPSDDDEACVSTTSSSSSWQAPGSSNMQVPLKHQLDEEEPSCENCTAHAGFLRSWRNTRCIITPLIEQARMQYPDYRLTLVGHSLGGAVAALAGLEFQARGWNPQITTFGEPRVGNQALVDHIDRTFDMTNRKTEERSFRRVTHIRDPIPMLPLDEWGFKMHSGEIYISKKDLPPAREDLRHCNGDADGKCIAGTDATDEDSETADEARISIFEALRALSENVTTVDDIESLNWGISDRFRLWELFFSHRDYFWRLGVCLPGGDPKDWWKMPFGNGEGNKTTSE